MTISSDTATAGEKELKTDWPFEFGLSGGTHKQVGKTMNLVADEIKIESGWGSL